MQEVTVRTTDELVFYASSGPFTCDIDAPEIEEGLRTGALDISDVVSGLAWHEAFSSVYELEVPQDRPEVQNVRRALDILAAIRELDPRPLNKVRSIERRLPTYCRHFSVLTTALLRSAGVPARSRCGFCPAPDDRFGAGRFLDHWWVERWNSDQARWVRIDTALSEQLTAALCLDFDPRDIPSGKYLSGSEAWQCCRSGDADPALFGIAVYWGAGMVRGNVIRDLAALNKVELLPWDTWGLMDDESSLGEGKGDPLLDEVADAVVTNDWVRLRALYEGQQALRPPASLVAASVSPPLQ